MDISCNGAKMYLVISFFPDLCFRYLVLNVSPDVVDTGEFCCLFVVCRLYICSAGYVELPIVLLYLLRCLVYHMLSKLERFTQSDNAFLL